MEALAVFLQTAFPTPTAESRRILEGVARHWGRIGSANHFAASIGLRNRHQLARQLSRAGLPPLETLTSWATVLHWVLEWEQNRTPLCDAAFAKSGDPAIYYRLVKRVTGEAWTRVREAGSGWLLLQMRERFGRTWEPLAARQPTAS